jgi:hypothetical protein
MPSAILVAEVDFPTPPLWFVKTNTCVICLSSVEPIDDFAAVASAPRRALHSAEEALLPASASLLGAQGEWPLSRTPPKPL